MLTLAIALALLIDAPFQGGLDSAPVSRGSRIPGLSADTTGPERASGQNACKKVDTQYVELTDQGAGATTPVPGAPLSQEPDADLIRAVLRLVDGRCEMVVVHRVRRPVATPGHEAD